eukprot:3467000-Rhodomonas_salina.9
MSVGRRAEGARASTSIPRKFRDSLVLSEGAWRKPGEHETLPRKSAPHRDVTRDGKGWEGKF